MGGGEAGIFVANVQSSWLGLPSSVDSKLVLVYVSEEGYLDGLFVCLHGHNSKKMKAKRTGRRLSCGMAGGGGIVNIDVDQNRWMSTAQRHHLSRIGLPHPQVSHDRAFCESLGCTHVVTVEDGQCRQAGFCSRTQGWST